MNNTGIFLADTLTKSCANSNQYKSYQRFKEKPGIDTLKIKYFLESRFGKSMFTTEWNISVTILFDFTANSTLKNVNVSLTTIVLKELMKSKTKN